MNTIPFSGRLKLSDEALKLYEAHGKAHGGYTRMIEKALEYYSDQGALSNTTEIIQIHERLTVHNVQLEEIKEILLQISQCLTPHSNPSNLQYGKGGEE